MKTVNSIFGHLIASHGVIGSARSEATPGQPRKRSVLAKLKPSGWNQGPPVADLSNHIRRDIGLDPVPVRDRWSDYRF